MDADKMIAELGTRNKPGRWADLFYGKRTKESKILIVKRTMILGLSTRL